MADQRRRGRGRSGRGGRIPKKGEGQAAGAAHSEAFISFPLDVTGPITVRPAFDEAAFSAALRDTLDRERRQATALQEVTSRTGEPALVELHRSIERHRDLLEGLARDLGVDGGGEAPGPSGDSSSWDLVARAHLARLGWLSLQRAAYASGDRRIDRVVKPVLREKDRHAGVLETYALRRSTQALFPESEE